MQASAQVEIPMEMRGGDFSENNFRYGVVLRENKNLLKQEKMKKERGVKKGEGSLHEKKAISSDTKRSML